MPRAIVSPKTIDALIRAKLATLAESPQVEALPVTWTRGNGRCCNWTIPGWLGEALAVDSCTGKLEHYLDFLRSQFDIPAEDHAGD